MGYDRYDSRVDWHGIALALAQLKEMSAPNKLDMFYAEKETKREDFEIQKEYEQDKLRDARTFEVLQDTIERGYEDYNKVYADLQESEDSIIKQGDGLSKYIKTEFATPGSWNILKDVDFTNADSMKETLGDYELNMSEMLIEQKRRTNMTSQNMYGRQVAENQVETYYVSKEDEVLWEELSTQMKDGEFIHKPIDNEADPNYGKIKIDDWDRNGDQVISKQEYKDAMIQIEKGMTIEDTTGFEEGFMSQVSRAGIRKEKSEVVDLEKSKESLKTAEYTNKKHALLAENLEERIKTEDEIKKLSEKKAAFGVMTQGADYIMQNEINTYKINKLKVFNDPERLKTMASYDKQKTKFYIDNMYERRAEEKINFKTNQTRIKNAIAQAEQKSDWEVEDRAAAIQMLQYKLKINQMKAQGGGGVTKEFALDFVTKVRAGLDSGKIDKLFVDTAELQDMVNVLVENGWYEYSIDYNYEQDDLFTDPDWVDIYQGDYGDVIGTGDIGFTWDPKADIDKGARFKQIKAKPHMYREFQYLMGHFKDTKRPADYDIRLEIFELYMNMSNEDFRAKAK